MVTCRQTRLALSNAVRLDRSQYHWIEFQSPMAIETSEEWEQARVALERRSSQVLAAFILSLIDAPNGIGNYVHIFAAADDPRAAADLLGHEIAFLRTGERDYDVRHRQGSEWVRRVDRALDAVEVALFPKDSGAAFNLLTALI